MLSFLLPWLRPVSSRVYFFLVDQQVTETLSKVGAAGGDKEGQTHDFWRCWKIDRPFGFDVERVALFSAWRSNLRSFLINL
jgi:hypothetical protein